MPAGGKQFEWWTKEAAEKELLEILEYIKSHPTCLFLSEAMEAKGHYITLYDYLINKFDFDSIKNEIKETLKNRCIKAGVKGEGNTAMLIFLLKNNYNMVDKIEQDLNINKGKFIVGDDE